MDRNELRDLQESISEYINDEVCFQKNSLRFKQSKCYAVKTGKSGLLDVARITYKETLDDAYELIDSYKSSTKFNQKRSLNSK